MKLKTKVVWLIAVSVLLTIGLIVIIFHEASERFLPGYNHVKLQEMSEQLSRRLEHVDVHDKEQLAREIEAFSLKNDRLRIELFASDGTLLYSSAHRSVPYTLSEIMERLANPFQRVFFGQDVSMVYEISIGGENHFAIFDVKGDALQPMQFFLYLKNWAVLPFLLAPLVMIVSLPTLFAFVFILWMTRRLKRLNQAMQYVDLSGDPVLLEDNHKDEIGELTKLYNGMIVKLYDQYRHIRQIEAARTKLVSQLSHDLRTPLSIIQGYAETLQRGSAHDKDTRIRHATIILQKADYMNELLRKLFRLAQLDDPSKAFQKSEGYIDSLLQTVMADYILILKDKGMEWHMDLPPSPIAATFDREGLTQVIRNLIDNAILHGSDGKYLAIRLKQVNGSVQIDIEDRGKGIPPHEVERIFEPFYRINRDRPSDGLGIGLTLADAIVRQHGGKIEVVSIPHVSNIFRVILPIDPSVPVHNQETA